MNKKNQSTILILLLWSLAVVVTLGSVVYQRLTGPTHEIRDEITVGDETIAYELLRSHDISADATTKLYVPDREITGMLQWRRLKSHDEWITHDLSRQGDMLVISIPRQPPAGKVIYRVSLVDGDDIKYDLSQEPVVIRFKGTVPSFILFPHIVFMFFSMLLAARSGLETVVNGKRAYLYSILTAALLFIGGIILGPIVQKYAFGAYWTGWPLGHDLTDNKTAVAMIFWFIALWRARKFSHGRIWIIAAAVIQLSIYLIPHSLLGSELDYTKMN